MNRGTARMHGILGRVTGAIGGGRILRGLCAALMRLRARFARKRGGVACGELLVTGLHRG